MTALVIPYAHDPVEEERWRTAALRSAVEEGLGLGAEQVFVVAPYPLPESGTLGLLGTAERDMDPRPSDIGAQLADVFGDDVLARTAVALVDCFTFAPPLAAAQEMAALTSRCAATLAIERIPEQGELPDPSNLLADMGVVATDDARIETPVGPARRLTLGRRAHMASATDVFEVFLMDWNGKARALADTLTAAGHRLVDRPEHAQVAMINNDYPGLGRLPYLDACVANGGRAYLYPDGASPTLMALWDGLYEPYARLSGVLATAPGHVEVAHRYGYPFPVHVVGWSMCPLRPRRPTDEVRTVLFAPEHPPYHGNLRPPRQNAQALEALLATGVRVTVRFLGDLAANGLREVDGVTYVRGELGDFNAMIAQIDAHDAVLATGTFPCLAVARGVTAVMWNTDVQYHHETNVVARNMDRYRDYVRYPFDLGSGSDLGELLHAAARDEKLVGEWRARFIGEPVQTDRLTAAIAG